MGVTESHMVHIFNGTRFIVYVTLNGRLFEYRKDGSADSKIATMARLGNGCFVQIPLVEKRMEMTIECRDEVERQVKSLKFFTQNNVSWVVRNHGVMRPKLGTLGLTSEEDYSQTSSTYFQLHYGNNWKYDFSDEIRFYSWDVDAEETFLKKDNHDHDDFEDMMDRHKAYDEDKNWVVLSRVHHPMQIKKPSPSDQAICREFIAALQLYTATRANPLPLVWLINWNVESLKTNRTLNEWQIQVESIDSLTDKFVFERLLLENEHSIFAIVHIQRGPIFTIHIIQEAFVDSLINQTEVWVADPSLDLSIEDRANRNLRLYHSTDCCKCWVPCRITTNKDAGAKLRKKV